MFTAIRLEGYFNFFIGMFLQLLYLPSTTVVKTEDLEDGLLRSFFNFSLSIIGNSDPVSLQFSRQKRDLIDEIDRGL